MLEKRTELVLGLLSRIKPLEGGGSCLQEVKHKDVNVRLKHSGIKMSHLCNMQQENDLRHCRG